MGSNNWGLTNSRGAIFNLLLRFASDKWCLSRRAIFEFIRSFCIWQMMPQIFKNAPVTLFIDVVLAYYSIAAWVWVDKWSTQLSQRVLGGYDPYKSLSGYWWEMMHPIVCAAIGEKRSTQSFVRVLWENDPYSRLCVYWEEMIHTFVCAFSSTSLGTFGRSDDVLLHHMITMFRVTLTLFSFI